MRSLARSTLALFIIVAATAIVGVAGLGSFSRPRPSYSFGAVTYTARPTFSSVTNTFSTAVGITKTCVSPVITTTAGALIGTVTAACDASTPAALSRWFYHKNKYSYSNTHTLKNTNTIMIMQPLKNICCDGYVCQGAATVTATLVGAPSTLTSAAAPYATATPNFPNARSRTCCLPQLALPITKLLCTTEGYIATTTPPTCLPGRPFLAGQNLLEINRLACLCCTGVIEVTVVMGGPDTYVFVCNPVISATGGVLGRCGALDPF